jgi:opacity protein-like surface antigen
MRTIFAASWCFLMCAAHISAQSPVPAGRGLSIDAGLGYAYVSHGESASSPVGPWGGDASITIGSSRLGLKADLAYARAATIPGTRHHNEVLSYLAGPVFRPRIHRSFDTYVRVLVGAARISGPVPLGRGGYLLGGWGIGLAWLSGGGVEYRVTDSIAIRTGVDYLRTSYFDPSLTFRVRDNPRNTATIKGAHVDVTVEAEDQTLTAKSKNDS